MFSIIVRKSLSVALNLLTLGGLSVGGMATGVGVYAGLVGLRHLGVSLLALSVLTTLLRLLRGHLKNPWRALPAEDLSE